MRDRIRSIAPESNAGEAKRPTAHTDARTSASVGSDKGGPKPLVIGVKNEKPVPDVVGKPIEACLALERAGHAGEVSYVRRAERSRERRAGAGARPRHRARNEQGRLDAGLPHRDGAVQREGAVAGHRLREPPAGPGRRSSPAQRLVALLTSDSENFITRRSGE